MLVCPWPKNKIRDPYRGIHKFKRSYQPRSNSEKDEDGDLLADSNNILRRRTATLSYIIYQPNITDTLHIDYLRVAIVSEKPIRYKSPGNNSMALVRERTIPTERLPLVREASANFCG
jgi:hypothetical protein